MLLRVAPKVAVAVLLPGVTEHVALVPLHEPLQPVKVEPEAAAAVNTTDWLFGKVAVQLGGQLIPVGLLVTEPVPPPAVATCI
jgi:hypothetical protein